MHNPGQRVQGCQPSIGKRVQIRRGYRWFLPVVMVTLGLAISSLFQPLPSYAQDGYGRLLVLVSYTIDAPGSEITVCLERETTAIVTVKRTLEFRGDTTDAPGASMDATVRATTQDSGIATVSGTNPAHASAGTNSWMRAYEVKLKGVSPGTTTV